MSIADGSCLLRSAKPSEARNGLNQETSAPAFQGRRSCPSDRGTDRSLRKKHECARCMTNERGLGLQMPDLAAKPSQPIVSSGTFRCRPCPGVAVLASAIGCFDQVGSKATDQRAGNGATGAVEGNCSNGCTNAGTARCFLGGRAGRQCAYRGNNHRQFQDFHRPTLTSCLRFMLVSNSRSDSAPARIAGQALAGLPAASG